MLKKIVIGLIAGLISGIFSTGGGLILVPAFLYILKMNEKEARATSITCILPMVVVSSIFYARNDYINLKLGVLCALGGVIGSCIGSIFLRKIPDYILKIFLIIFLVSVGINMLGIL